MDEYWHIGKMTILFFSAILFIESGKNNLEDRIVFLKNGKVILFQKSKVTRAFGISELKLGLINKLLKPYGIIIVK